MDAIRGLWSEIRAREYGTLTEASGVGEARAQLALLLTVGGALILLVFFAELGAGDRGRSALPVGEASDQLLRSVCSGKELRRQGDADTAF